MRSLCIFVTLWVCAFAAFGQTDRGTITGTVSDPAGAVVASAPIEVKNTQTGAVYQAATSDTGNYTLPQMPIGTYEITIGVAGFKKFVRQNVTVQATQTVRIDATLEVGSATESVTVNAETSLLKTESGDVSVNVTGDRLVNLGLLPIGNGFSSSHGVRNPMAVSTLAPGTYFDPNLNIRVNGAPSNTESVRVEGQDVTNGVVTFSQAQTQPSVEALQELAVQSSNYSAEFGQAGAGVFNYTVKSGTNSFHGSLFDYNSNEAYNASQAYTHNRPKTRRDDMGGTLGGPVRIPKVYNGRDRTFFFFSYETFREVGIISNQFPTVPTDAYRAGNFATALSNKPITGNPVDSSGQPARDGQIFDPLLQSLDAQGRRIRQPFVGNIIPVARFDPSAIKLLNLIPRSTSSALVNNFNRPYATDRRTPIPALKLDHSLSAKAKVSYYWSTTSTAVQYCTPLCGSDGLPDPITATRGTFIESQTQRVNFDYTLAPTVLLHLGAGYLHNDFKDKAPTTDFDLQGVLGIAGAPVGPKDGARFPVFGGDTIAAVRQAMTGLNSQGGMSIMGPAAGQVRAIEIKPTFNASVSWVKGNHTYKFGGEGRTDGFIDYTYSNTTGNFVINAEQTGNPWFSDAGVSLSGGTVGFPLASLMLGRVTSYQLSPLSAFRGGRLYLSFFAQDTWKVTRKLTLDYGLRYDFSTYAKEQYGRAPGFSPTVANPTAGGHPGASIFEGDGPGHCGCNLANNYPLAFGPRFGVAYQLNPKTVLRGGIGITYAPYTGGRYAGAPGANQTVNAPGVADPAMILSGGFTNTVNGVTTPFQPVWPDIRPGLFPAPGTISGAPLVFDQNSGRPARQLQWSVGVQREIYRNLAIDVSYVANRGAWWRTNTLTNLNVYSQDFLKSQYGLDITNAADRAILSAQVGSAAAGRFQGKLPYAGFSPANSVAQALRPFPQFGNLQGAGPLGNTWYDSLQAKATKRFSHGLDASYTFTWAKELQLGADNDGGGGQINDILNRNTNKQLSSFSRPLVSILALNYTLPKLGSNKWLRYAVADWNFATSMQYASGLPIQVPTTAQSSSNLLTSFLRGTRAERIPGVPLFLQDLNCHCFDPAQTQVLNPAAWKDPTPGTFSPSAAYYDDYRFRRVPRESFSFGRIFRIKESITFSARVEFTNPLNRAQVPNPFFGTGGAQGNYTSAIATTTANGLRVNNSGFGAVQTLGPNAVIGERSGLLVGRLQF
ncbi:MAG: hypothetical protein JWO19_1054 [Bryobacterales bacterium]|nr:hypothetical protein [Bryobacterales bacterium]